MQLARTTIQALLLGLVAAVLTAGCSSKTATPQPENPAAQFGIRQVLNVHKGSFEGSECLLGDPAMPDELTTQCFKQTKYDLGRQSINTENIAEAELVDSTTVLVTLDDEGARALSALTAKVASGSPPKNQVAFLVGGTIANVVTVREPIAGGQVEVEVLGLDAEWATRLASVGYGN
jgi:hypothetical protein